MYRRATLSRLPVVRRHMSLSVAQGSTTPPLVHKTLFEYFQQDVLAKHLSRPALICRNERPRKHGGPVSHNLGRTDCLAWDFEEFHRHINALARGLLSMGVQRGERVAVIMGNNSAYATLQYACASIGAILVTINPAYRAHELIGTMKLVGVKHVFVVPHIRSSDYLAMLEKSLPGLASSSPGNIQVEELPELRNVVVFDAQKMKKPSELPCLIDWRESLLWNENSSEGRQQADIIRSLHKDDVANLQFTSGTTGAPKAVSLTHSNLLNNAIYIAKCMALSEKDILCNAPPLFHCFGLVLGNLAAWSQSACVVYASDTFEPRAVVQSVIEERCTALHGVPTHFLGVLAEVERRQAEGETLDFSSLRTGIAAGSPIPIGLMKKLISQLNLSELTISYGMTETSPVSFQSTTTDPLLKRVETVGKIHPHVKAKIIDPEGNIVPIGTPGEVCIAGYLLQKGYWNDSKQTAEVMRADEDGTLWMHSGDEGIMDEDGYLSIVGRRKDIIIRGGENLFPVQIENVLTAHPKILEAAAVSVADERYGEVVGVWIVLGPGSPLSREEVQRHVSAEMNPQNSPAWVWYAGKGGDCEELPKTASGKVQKHILRNLSKELAKQGIGHV